MALSSRHNWRDFPVLAITTTYDFIPETAAATELAGLCIGLHVRSLLQTAMGIFPILVYSDSEVSIKNIRQLRRKLGKLAGFQLLHSVYTLPDYSSNIFHVRGHPERQTGMDTWSPSQVGIFLADLTAKRTPHNLITHSLPLDVSSLPLFCHHSLTWICNKTPMMTTVQEVVKRTIMPKYLESRDTSSRHLTGLWHTSTPSLAAKVWHFSTTPVSLLATYQRLIWDKSFHPGHISAPPTQCPCGATYSLAHIICHCRHPSLQAQRQHTLHSISSQLQYSTWTTLLLFTTSPVESTDSRITAYSTFMDKPMESSMHTTSIVHP